MAKPITETIKSYGYHHEKTAADTSFQNGIVEQPHRTLKEKMRCMLYSSRLGVEFWVDAIRHTVWLYNRTYHSAIECTPFQRYTGQKPCVSSLITFGSKVVARKPCTRSRQTSADPNAYNGIFLGYNGTSHNIKYYDINTNDLWKPTIRLATVTTT